MNVIDKTRRYMAEILSTRRKTPINQSILATLFSLNVLNFFRFMHKQINEMRLEGFELIMHVYENN